MLSFPGATYAETTETLQFGSSAGLRETADGSVSPPRVPSKKNRSDERHCTRQRYETGTPPGRRLAVNCLRSEQGRSTSLPVSGDSVRPSGLATRKARPLTLPSRLAPIALSAWDGRPRSRRVRSQRGAPSTYDLTDSRRWGCATGTCLAPYREVDRPKLWSPLSSTPLSVAVPPPHDTGSSISTTPAQRIYYIHIPTL